MFGQDGLNGDQEIYKFEKEQWEKILPDILKIRRVYYL